MSELLEKAHYKLTCIWWVTDWEQRLWAVGRKDQNFVLDIQTQWWEPEHLQGTKKLRHRKILNSSLLIHASFALFPAIFTHYSAFSPGLRMCGLWHRCPMTCKINSTKLHGEEQTQGDEERDQGIWNWGCLAFKMNLRMWVQSTDGEKSEKLRNFRT